MSGLRIERVLPATPERVWHALTDPAALAAWFWPASFGTTVSVDAQVGGAFRIAAPSAGMAVLGTYRVLDPPDRLEFTWQWEGDRDLTNVRIELSAMDGHTALVLTHDGFPDEATRLNHQVGWSDCLDRLPHHLQTHATQG